MERTTALLMVIALAAPCAPVFSAVAETVSHTSGKPKSARGQTVPMRHDQLTLYPRGRPVRPQKAYSAFPHQFDQRTPIHNTIMGVQRW